MRLLMSDRHVAMGRVRCPGTMRRRLPVLMVAALGLPAPALAQDEMDQLMKGAPVVKREKEWKVTVGAGARVGPEHEGASDFDVNPFPYLSVSWNNRVFLNWRHGLGVYALRNKKVRLGASIGYAPGRDDDDRLRGLGDIDPGARAHVFGAYSFGWIWIHAEASRDIGGSDGFRVEPGFSLHYQPAPDVTLSSSFTATWVDGRDMNAYFSVTPAQSARSGLPVYDADAGFKRTSVDLTLTWDFAEDWFVRTSFGAGYLLGDAADSPITERRFQPSGTLVVGYEF